MRGKRREEHHGKSEEKTTMGILQAIDTRRSTLLLTLPSSQTQGGALLYSEKIEDEVPPRLRWGPSEPLRRRAPGIPVADFPDKS